VSELDEYEARLSVNINGQCAEILREAKRERGWTTTEAIRHAVALLGYFEAARTAGLARSISEAEEVLATGDVETLDEVLANAPAPSSLRAELAEAKATIARLTVELQKMTRQRDAHKSAAADWAAESKRIKDWGVASIEAVAAEQEPIVEAAKALARTWQQAIADGFNQVDLTMPLNLLVAAVVEEGNKT
jgi:hypothetical protein